MIVDYIKQKENYKLKISVYIYIGMGASTALEYRIKDVSLKPKGKRKFTSPYSYITDDYKYRQLGFDTEAKSEYVKNLFLKYCTMEDIQEAVEYAYQQIKPTEDNISFYH